MSIGPENTNGKFRPGLPRASDTPRVPNVALTEAAGKPPAGRTAGGQFAAENPHGFGARWKASIKRTLGPKTLKGDADLVYRDSYKVYLATLRAMPCDAAPVRSLAALHGRHLALNGFFTTKAAEAGLTTPEGQKLQTLADAQSQRAERVLISCIHTAKALAPPTAKTGTVAKMRARVAAEVESAKGGQE